MNLSATQIISARIHAKRHARKLAQKPNDHEAAISTFLDREMPFLPLSGKGGK